MRSSSTRLAASLIVALGSVVIAGSSGCSSDPSEGAGGAGGTGGATSSTTGTGGAGGCQPTTCPGEDTKCRTRACIEGECGFENAPAGEVDKTLQIGWDCAKILCDGAGNQSIVADDTDLPDDGEQCTVDTCDNGAPANSKLPVGSACDFKGGVMCSPAGTCVQCLAPSDCESGICEGDQCIPATCGDDLKNGVETDVDCGGGTCDPCQNGQLCSVPADCASVSCIAGTCEAPTCVDVAKNGTETDVDCGGGSCPPCVNGKMCVVSSDCEGDLCVGSLCVPGACVDGMQNFNETDVDCGGNECGPCQTGDSCVAGTDCVGGSCIGNICAPTCTDTVKNGTETDVDCGGGACPGCDYGEVCNTNVDCKTQVCSAGSCGCNDHMVISEIRSLGPNGGLDDFAELYNPTPNPILLDNTWVLEQRCSTMACQPPAQEDYVVKWTGTFITVPPFGHVLIGGSQYTQMPAKEGSFGGNSPGIADGNSIRLRKSGVTVDAVCYYFDATSQAALQQPFYECEGTAVFNPVDIINLSNVSIERKVGGAAGSCIDTNNNANDFAPRTPADPQNSSSPSTP